MRTRGPSAFPWASSVGLTDGAPIDVPWAQALNWYHDVAIWQIDVNIQDASSSTIALASGPAYWNTKNFLGNPFTAGVPATEQQLAIGWQIFNFNITLLGAGTNVNFNLFTPVLSVTGTNGQGITWDIPANPTRPFFSLEAATGHTSAAGTSAVTVDIDGLSVPFTDGTLAPWTGSVSIQPSVYWENRKADTTAPVHNSATNVLIIPAHQTDELPSSS